MKGIILYFLIFLTVNSIAWADMESTVKKYDQFLNNKISTKNIIKTLNSELYLAYPVKDIKLVTTNNKVKVLWFLETDQIKGTIEVAKSEYVKPISKKRLLRSLSTLESFKKVERSIASIPQVEQNLAKRDFSNKKPLVNAGIQFGQVGITNADKKLNFNLVKASGSYRVKWGNGYSLAATASVVRFLDIVYSEGANSKSFENSLYEYGIDFNKNFGKYSFGANLSSLNYIILSDETTSEFVFTPRRIIRASSRYSYSLSDESSLTVGAGLINGTGLSGFDYSIGVGYHFGDKKEYLISPSLYSSTINIADGGSDQSTAMTFAFSFNID